MHACTAVADEVATTRSADLRHTADKLSPADVLNDVRVKNASMADMQSHGKHSVIPGGCYTRCQPLAARLPLALATPPVVSKHPRCDLICPQQSSCSVRSIYCWPSSGRGRGCAVALRTQVAATPPVGITAPHQPYPPRSYIYVASSSQSMWSQKMLLRTCAVASRMRAGV